MPDTRTIESIEEEAVSIIEDLDATAFDLGFATNIWHETETPFDLIDDNHALGHLAFEVAVLDVPNTETGRATERNSDAEFAVDQTAYVEAVMSVAFTFGLRPSQQKADLRTASNAAQQIVRALLAPWNYAGNGTVQVLLDNPYRPTLDPAGAFVLVDQDYRVLFDYDTSANPP